MANKSVVDQIISGLSDKQVKELREKLGKKKPRKESAEADENSAVYNKAFIEAFKSSEGGIFKKARAGASAAGKEFTRVGEDPTSGVTKKAEIIRTLFPSKYGKGIANLIDLLSKKGPKVQTTKQKQKTGQLEASADLNDKIVNVEKVVLNIAKDVSYIKQRLSPKQFTARSGEKTQKVSYDPMAPAGEQFRQVEGSGDSKSWKRISKIRNHASCSIS